MNQKLKLIQEHPEIKDIAIGYMSMWQELHSTAKEWVSVNDIFDEYVNSLKEKPLFITNGDNEEVFEGDEYWFVDPKILKMAHPAKASPYSEQKLIPLMRFKSFDKANQYIIENARVLSIADLKKYMDDARNSLVPIYLSDKTEYGAESIVKQRLNLK